MPRTGGDGNGSVTIDSLSAQAQATKQKILTTQKMVGGDTQAIPTNQKATGNTTSSGGMSALPDIFGLPPDSLMPETQRKMLDSMPVCHFVPSQPVFKLGLDLFTLSPAWDKSNNSDPSYIKLLNSHGLTTNNNAGEGIKVAYLADNFPTDTFTNEYGENFLQSMTDVASSGAAQLSQFFGAKNAGEAIKKMGSAAGKHVPKDIDIGGMKIPIASPITALAKGAVDLTEGILKSTGMGSAAGMIGRLMAGARLDFPMVWKSSGFQPSYSLTVRLYNPNPRSVESSKRYIVGPIVALMLLAVPITQDGSTYSWPFLHKITSPGIFELNPGFIQNITVIKGGDQQQISQQQRLAMADVRIDMGSLYSSMVAGGSSSITAKTRPTVRKYMDNMLGTGATTPKRHQIFDRRGQRLGEEAYKDVQLIDRQSKLTGRQDVWGPRRDVNPQPNPGDAPTATEGTETPLPRVTTSRQNQASFLAVNTPTSYGFRATDEEQ